jgi:hypothetical protein
MSPEVTAAIIAVSGVVLTVIATVAVQISGRRATSRDTQKALEEQREQLNTTLAAQHEQLDRTLAEQRTRTLNERFATAAGQLGGDKPPAVRLAGVYAMSGLADDWPENRQTCADVLCAYLRLPYAPDPGNDASVQEQLDFRASREVRHTVIRVIAAHLSDGAAVSWQGLSFDFNGVVFDGGDFRGAVFSGGLAVFDGAEFSSGTVRFNGAKFSGGEVFFGGAKFSGGKIRFARAEFSGGTVSFRDIELSSGTVDFGRAHFTGGTVLFHGARFAGGTVSFAGPHSPAARSASEPPSSPAPWSGSPPSRSQARRSALPTPGSPAAMSPSPMSRSPAAMSPSPMPRSPAARSASMALDSPAAPSISTPSSLVARSTSVTLAIGRPRPHSPGQTRRLQLSGFPRMKINPRNRPDPRPGLPPSYGLHAARAGEARRAWR